MFVIEVTWKAEWVGGLTFETHPAHRDAVPHAAPTQTQARLNSLKSRSLGTGHFLCVWLLKKRLTIRQTRARKSIFRGLPVLESCCFSLFLLFFLPCLRRRKQNKKKSQRNEMSRTLDYTADYQQIFQFIWLISSRIKVTCKCLR